MFNYGIGGQERKGDVNEAISDIGQNRTLLVQKLTADAPYRPEIVEGLKTIDDVFNHFKPEMELEFTDEEGSSSQETLQFRTVADFGKNRIVEQSGFLQQLNQKSADYQQIMRQLKSNKALKTMLENPESKAAFLAALASMIQEIEDAQ
jgi:predicted component of type VI protein secretion system